MKVTSSGERAGLPEHPAARTLLLGLGNDILSDDGVGLKVVAALRPRLAGQRELTLLESSEMGLSLLDLVAGFERLVLVDAVQTGQALPGTWHEIEGGDLPSMRAVSPHFLGLGEVLTLGVALGLPMPRSVTIFAIEVADPFTVGTQLSPSVAAALPKVVESIAARLESLTPPAPEAAGHHPSSGGG